MWFFIGPSKLFQPHHSTSLCLSGIPAAERLYRVWPGALEAVMVPGKRFTERVNRPVIIEIAPWRCLALAFRPLHVEVITYLVRPEFTVFDLAEFAPSFPRNIFLSHRQAFGISILIKITLSFGGGGKSFTRHLICIVADRAPDAVSVEMPTVWTGCNSHHSTSRQCSQAEILPLLDHFVPPSV